MSMEEAEEPREQPADVGRVGVAGRDDVDPRGADLLAGSTSGSQRGAVRPKTRASRELDARSRGTR